MKPIRLTQHAMEQCIPRGTNEREIIQAVRNGSREPAKMGRELCRYDFSLNDFWQNKKYAIKQVAPVIKEELDEIVVITIYTFYY